ncbi:hypothetical protein PWT90_07598 [Aphanocladium album]|nr:hypothetical protein PWT90_07598 [Aphanocladium album]
MATELDQDLYSDGSETSDSAEQDQSLLPTDGYFQPSVGRRRSQPAEDPTSASQTPCHAVPHIPDVMVHDPTLSRPGVVKETEALQRAQQPAPILDGPPASHVASSRRPQDDGDDSIARQNSLTDRPYRFDASNAGPRTDTSRTVLPPTAAIRDGLVGPRRLAQSVDEPPAYTPTRPVNYGTVETHSHQASEPHIMDEAAASVESDSEPLLASRPASINSTLDAELAGAANEHLLSNKRGLDSHFCLLLLITAALSSLITAGVIFLPSTPKVFAAPTWPLSPKNREPISMPEAEPPLIWNPPVGWKCRDTPDRVNRASYPVSLGPESALNIVEQGWNIDSKVTAERTVRVFGDIVVLSSRRVASPQVSLEGISNDPRIRSRMDISSGHLTHTYKLTGPPPFPDWPNEDSLPCYQVRITVWLPAGTTCRSAAFLSENLNVQLRVGLNVSTTDQFVATSDSGNIVAPHIMDVGQAATAPYRLQSPDCFMVSELGAVQGWFPFYNRLTLVSGLGEVTAQVGLKSLDLLQGSSPQLVASSRRGNINLTAVPPQRDRFGEIDGKFPERDYYSVVQTRMGNITAQLAMGSRTEFETVSGNTQVDLQPILGRQTRQSTRNLMLTTLSETGDSQIRIREPIWTDAIKQPGLNEQAAVYREPWGNLDARHISSGGNMLITYPDSWTGRINWQGAESEQLSILGSGVTILRQWGSSIKHIEATRGTGRSVVNIDGQEGSVILAIGRDITQNDTEQLLPSRV